MLQKHTEREREGMTHQARRVTALGSRRMVEVFLEAGITICPPPKMDLWRRAPSDIWAKGTRTTHICDQV
jgi:hypothetical protein